MDRPIAFWNSSYVRWPSIWSSTTSPVRGTMAIGQSASPKLSSSLLRSRQTTSSIFPEAHEVTRSRIGTPASARATLAAVRPAHRVPASAWRTSMQMSTDVRGNCSLKTTELKASEMTFEISTDRRSGPGRFRSDTLKGAMLYRHWTRARLARPVHRREDLVPAPFDVRGSVGPPQDACLDPNRSQLIERPTIQAASVGVNQFHLFLDVLDVFHGKPSLGGPRPSPSSFLPLDQFPHSFRQADRLGPLLDQADRHRRDRGAAVIPVQPHPTVLPHVNATPGQFHDQGHHAPLLADHPRHFGRRDLDDHAAGQASGLALLHRQLDALNLVDAQDVTHDHVADLQVPCRVAEFDPPGRFRRVERRGIGRVDVDEPVGWALVDHFANHGVAPLRDVPPVERDHADDALVLVPNAQLCRENLSAFAVCARPGFQPGAADGFARNDNRAERPTALHRCLSLTQRVETEAAT